MRYSVIVPVYNRPDEVRELLESLCAQPRKDVEVLIVEDGSAVPCEEVVRTFEDRLTVRYYSKPNSGPGQTRNYGAKRAEGEWLIILDSDVIVPEGYFDAIDAELAREDSDAFGGPDRAHKDFTPIQKAINYAMTSFFTTGGIRGGKKKLDKFYPRSFNMGIRRDVYQRLGGFSKMRFGEDIDFSIRIFKAGCHCRLFPGAWVYHKRRTDFRKFWRQVFNSGIARINLYKKYPDSLKLVHLLPMVFTLGVAFLTLLFIDGLLTSLFSEAPGAGELGRDTMALALAPLILYSLLIFADSARQNHSVKIGLLSVRAAFIQLMGYGCGFLQAWWRRCVRGQDEFTAYEKNFYK